MDGQAILERLSRSHRVYGDPYESGDVTVIPASVIYGGGGFGSGENEDKGSGEGGGGGLVARPVGAYVIKNGEVRWEPAVDVSRIVLGGQILVGLLAVLLFRRLRNRR